MKFKLKAQVSRSEVRTIRRALKQLAAKSSVRKADGGFVVEAEMEGTSAREMNRTLLSALRKVERKTTLRAEWTSGDNITERFFDYVFKKTVTNCPRTLKEPGLGYLGRSFLIEKARKGTCIARARFSSVSSFGTTWSFSTSEIYR
jgi:hypothetical protein